MYVLIFQPLHQNDAYSYTYHRELQSRSHVHTYVVAGNKLNGTLYAHLV
jgi:hypothetical protein